MCWFYWQHMDAALTRATGDVNFDRATGPASLQHHYSTVTASFRPKAFCMNLAILGWHVNLLPNDSISLVLHMYLAGNCKLTAMICPLSRFARSMSEIFSEGSCVRALLQMMITGVTRQLTSSCRVQDRKLISDPAEPLLRMDICILNCIWSTMTMSMAASLWWPFSALVLSAHTLTY